LAIVLNLSGVKYRKIILLIVQKNNINFIALEKSEVMNMKDMQEIKEAIDNLGNQDLKSFLRLILGKMKLLKEHGESFEESIVDLVELYDEILGIQDKKALWNPAPHCTHVHIVIGLSFAGSMKQALNGLGWSETHKVVALAENYAIGPLYNLDSLEGRKARSEWFRNNISEAFESYTDFEDEYQDVMHKIGLIPEQAKIIIWSSKNALEQIGMRHVLYLMRKKSNTIVLMDACQICEQRYNRTDKFINYLHSGEVPTDKLKEALLCIDEGNEQSISQTISLVEEWKNISQQHGNLHIWRNNAVFEVPDDFYDRFLLEKLDKLRPPSGENDFLKSARLIGEAMGYCDQYIGDSYFEYRLRELIYNGILEIKGLPAAMRYYSVRRKIK
jgi:hypothetical protein